MLKRFDKSAKYLVEEAVTTENDKGSPYLLCLCWGGGGGADLQLFSMTGPKQHTPNEGSSRLLWKKFAKFVAVCVRRVSLEKQKVFRVFGE
jgi:hypothetical protein